MQALHADGRAQRLRYDALHRLREVWQREAAGGAWQRVACYRYDPFGRRLAKTVFGHGNDNSNAAAEPSTTTYAGWDGDRLVHTEGPQGLQHVLYEPGSFAPLLRLEREQAVPTAMQALLAMEGSEGLGEAQAFFAALPPSQREMLQDALHGAMGPDGEGLIARMQGVLPAEVATLLASGLQEVGRRQLSAARSAPTRIRHFLCDHLGTPIALVDANGPQAGLVTWAATYHAWGAVREEYDPHGIGQPIRFQGQQLDVETGLHYNRFRYYDPRASQYVTQDPVGLNGGLNYYAYATGNPIKYVDPTGQFAMLLPLIPAITGTDLLIGAGLGGALIGLDKIFNRPGKTPNTGEPGSCHVNPGSGQERKYGSDGKPEYDIDWDHDHGQGSPHGHNWDGDKRDNGWPISSWPHGRTSGQNP
nr:RHS repeat-associated core domain-containing protein [Paracidovorax avenae]